MSTAHEQLDLLNKQIADLTARRDALEMSAEFIDSMEGKVDLTVPQLADLIASYEAHRKKKATSEAVAVDAVADEEEKPALDAVAEPAASAGK